MYKVQNQSEKRMSQLPGWLWPNSNILPPLYKKIWEFVREEKTQPGIIHGEVLVDTNKIFPLLLTSQLTTEILGYIWSIANKKYAGQLTEQELYTVLALVALAQASYPFNSLEVLHLIRVPPIPNLNLALLNTNSVIPGKNEPKPHDSKTFTGLDSPSSNSSSVPNFITSSNSLPSFNSSSATLYKSENRTNSVVNSSSADSLFSEVKNSPNNCALRVNFPSGLKNHSTDTSDDFSEFQSAPLSAIPQILIWDSKQGSAIGSRLANHNLGVKKPVEKLKKTASKSTSLGRNTAVNFPPSKEFHLDEQQQTLSFERNSTFVGCTEMQLNEAGIPVNSGNSSFGYRDVNFEKLTELFPKCNLKNQTKTVILRDTVIRNDPPKSTEINCKNMFSGDKIPEKETEAISKPLSTKKLSLPGNTQDLMNLQQTEDKYSALRILDEEPVEIFSEKNSESVDSFAADDFGDFVSAEQPAIVAPNIESLSTESNMDLLSEFDFKGDDFLINDIKTETSLVQEITDAFDALGLEEFREHPPLENKLDVHIDPAPKEDCLSVNSIELGNNVPGILTRSGSVPSLDLKSFLSPSQDEESTVENMHQMIYWEWKQYMESCVLLLQVAASIFSNISSEAVLREVLASAQGYNFLCNLAEVAAICRRVNFSHKEMDINIMGFDDLLMDIDRIWADMEPFYTNIPIVTELPVWPLHQNDSVTCALCLTVITSGKVAHNENNYHVTCANLWLNCINNNLPVLRNPSVQSYFGTSNSIN